MESLSKAKIKHFSALQHKKYRQQYKLFVVEGWKMVEEALLADWPIEAIVLLEKAHDHEKNRLLEPLSASVPVYLTEQSEFQRLSSQVSPEGILAVVSLPEGEGAELKNIPSGPGFLLEGIQDPGNLGTILRTADWMGMKQIVLGPGTVDPWNPKVLRASMGAIFRVSIRQCRTDWHVLLEQEGPAIWLADMEGIELSKVTFSASDWILLGNEANGISAQAREIDRLQKVHIPRLGGGESLNVGVAAGILAWKLCGV